MVGIKRGSRTLYCVLVAGLILAAGCGSDEDQTRPMLDTLPPTTPLDLIAENAPLSGGVKLDWSANTVDPDLAGYIVYRSRSPERGFQPLNARPVVTNTYLDGGAVPGETYWYAVSARDVHQNESARSTQTRILTGETAPIRDRN